MTLRYLTFDNPSVSRYRRNKVIGAQGWAALAVLSLFIGATLGFIL